MSEQSEQIVIADLNNPLHANAMIEVLNHYANGIMGGGEKLSDFTRANLAAELARLISAPLLLALAPACCRYPIKACSKLSAC